MAQFERITVYQNIISTGLVPLFYDPSLENSKNVIEACYKGGARIFEFTNRGDWAPEIFRALVLWAKDFPGLILGIGSVIDSGTAAHFLQAGANFVVSPIFSEEVARVCNKRKVAYIPGCGSLTEISAAEELGAEIIKVFPAAQLGGPGFLKAVKGPFPWSRLMASGGVSTSQENLAEWFNAGASCVGIGSKLISKNPDGEYDYRKIENDTGNCIKYIKTLKGG